jgi:hypothetical protein
MGFRARHEDAMIVSRLNLPLKSTGIQSIYFDVAVLLGFSALLITACIALFKRQI